MKGRPAKTAIYFAHFESFGHTSRVMAVAQVIKKRFPNGDLFFIQTGAQQPKAKINQLGKVYLLPPDLMDRRPLKEMLRKGGAQAEKRAQVCMDVIIRERPDFFITEFFPLGNEDCRHELLLSLAEISRQGGLLWAVAGYPLLTGKAHGWREKIIKLYQQIIIFSPPLEKKFIAGFVPQGHDRQEYSDFFERHAPKIKFAGYLLPKQQVALDDEDVNLPKPPVPKGACRVTVLRGGGACFPKVIAQAICASDLLGDEYYLTVVAGPSTTMEEWYFFNTLVGKKKIHNLVLLRSVGDYEGCIKNSDVCVCVASYHTSVMLLKHRKKAVLIPFEGYGSQSIYEQPARAALLKEVIGAKILSIKDLTADHLAAVIRQAAGSGQITSQVPQEWFSGEEILDKTLTGLFGQ